MIEKEVSAKVPIKEGRNENELSATILVPMADSLEEAVDWCGEEPVLTNAFANWRVTIQSGIRAALIAGKTADQIQEDFRSAKMGVARVGGKVDVMAAYRAMFQNATPEKQAEMLDALREEAEGADEA